MLLYGTKFGGKCLIGCLAAWALCVPAFPADSIPLITSVTQSTHAPQLTINGTNFGTALPAVTLNGQSASVLSYTNSVVVVTLPTAIESAPGTYILSLTNNSDSNYDLLRTAVFVAAIGTAGPAGTIGPA